MVRDKNNIKNIKDDPFFPGLYLEATHMYACQRARTVKMIVASRWWYCTTS